MKIFLAGKNPHKDQNCIEVKMKLDNLSNNGDTIEMSTPNAPVSNK
jgi:hypothetical protein